MSINNDNIVKIGVALKWRNTFDLTKKYYQENVVTACGCVFRCKVLQAQGKSPIKMTDDQGHIVYTNTDVWDVLVDMAYYYNYTVDTRNLTQQTLDSTKKLDEASQKQQKEIEALQIDNHDQWNHINDIEKANAEQQRELNSIFDTISCFSEGIWIDTLLWGNETIWDNNKCTIADAIAEEHQSEYQKMLDNIRAYNGCFEKGEWANPFFWNDTDVWYNTPNSISETENDIINHDNRLTALESQFALFIPQLVSQQTIIEQHQSQLETLMDCFTVLNVGKWQNLLLWDNTSKWSNILITEATASVGTGGDSTVAVKSYDPDTTTVTI